MERSYNEIFSENLNRYMRLHDLSQRELARKLDVGVATVNTWCNGKKLPRMDKVDALCRLFHVERSALMNDWSHAPTKEYTSDHTVTTATEEATNSKDYSANRVSGVYEIIELTKKMTDEQLSEVIRFARYILQR